MGCICFPLLRSYNAHKLLPHASPCLFLGYPAHSKGYIYQDPITSRVYISRHVHFNENEFLSSLPLSNGPSYDSGLHSTPIPTSISFIPTQSSTPTSCPSSNTYLDQQPLLQALSDMSTSAQPYTHAFPSHILSPQPTSSTSTSSSPPTISSSHISPPAISTVLPQVPIALNTHPMVTRSKDGIFKPKALVVMSDLVQCAFSKKVSSPSKPDYTITEPPSYKIVA